MHLNCVPTLSTLCITGKLDCQSFIQQGVADTSVSSKKGIEGILGSSNKSVRARFQKKKEICLR